MRKHETEIKWQVFVAVIYACIGFGQAFLNGTESGLSFGEFTAVCFAVISQFVILNLVANFLLLRFPFTRFPIHFVFYLITILSVYFLLKYWILYPNYIDIFATYSTNQNLSPNVFFLYIHITNLIVSYGLAYGLYSIKRTFRAEKRSKELELEINNAKLNTLKNQINPHFLYNTLSYMYAQARPVSNNLSKSILLLSGLMRYSLNNATANVLQSLEAEIDYIQNYLEIHRLRFDGNFHVNFEVNGILQNHKIIPLLLINYVENVLKHGILNDQKKPASISLSIDKTQLIFETKNHKQIGVKSNTIGKGLINAKTRLDLIFKTDYELYIIETDLDFNLNLIINF